LQPDTLRRLVDYLSANPKVAIVGPRLLQPDGALQRDISATGLSPNRRVAMVQGACLLLRRSLLQQVGLLDERFFLYFEETDLCKRAADRGWEVHYVGEAAAIHIGSQSTEERRPSARHFIASLYRFHHKHYGLGEAVALWSILMPYHGARMLRLALLRRFKPSDAALRADLRTARERFAAHWWLLTSLRRVSRSLETRSRVAGAWTR
jgi:GT2 family glycosyltransferase